MKQRHEITERQIHHAFECLRAQQGESFDKLPEADRRRQASDLVKAWAAEAPAENHKNLSPPAHAIEEATRAQASRRARGPHSRPEQPGHAPGE